MNERAPIAAHRSPDDLETTMQKVSLVISLAALGMMIGGIAEAVASGVSLTLPGTPVVSLSSLLRLHGGFTSLFFMSAGIVVLSLLPVVRVLLALGIYLRRRDLFDALVALIVVLELILSIRLGH